MIKELKTYYYLTFNVMIKSCNYLYLFNISSLKNRERQIIYVNNRNEKTLMIINFVSIIII